MINRAMALAVLCVTLLCVLAGCVEITYVSSNQTHYNVSAGTATVDAEAADTSLKQVIGLSGRTALDPNAGMLFLFSHPERQSVWMKDMRFPLDIVFITEDLHVLQVYADVPPCSALLCPTYTSDAPVLYVLEVNAGFCASRNIVSGTPVSITPG